VLDVILVRFYDPLYPSLTQWFIGDSLPTPQDLDLPTSSIIIDQSVLANLPAISEYAANFSSSTGSAENPLSTADADGMDWSLMQETFNFDANSQRGSMDMFQFNGGSAGTDGYRQIVLESPPVESPREEGVQNTSHWVEKLSDINIKLFQHMSSIPPVETGSCGKAVVFPDKQFAVSSCLPSEIPWLDMRCLLPECHAKPPISTPD